MKNAMQLKAVMRNFSKEYKVPAQAVLQNYMLERLLERISVSRHQYQFIIKGGFIITALAGIASRTTMDLDATVKALRLTEQNLQTVFQEIISQDIDDGIQFTIVRVDEIREVDNYPGYRISFEANLDRLKVPLKVDLTTGDKMTPDAIDFKYQLLMEDRTIDILAYNVETLLSEKYETILRRGRLNTRLRDYYDILLIMKLKSVQVDYVLLSEALSATSEYRGSRLNILDAKNVLEDIQSDSLMLNRWVGFQKEYEYARNIPFADVMEAIKALGQALIIL